MGAGAGTVVVIILAPTGAMDVLLDTCGIGLATLTLTFCGCIVLDMLDCVC